MKEQILKQINDSIEVKKTLDIAVIENSAKMLAECLKNGNKILLCGNGGSAADCQHIAAELVIRFRSSVVRPALPAIALTCDTSILTAGGNDIGFDNIFAQQVAALGNAGDILLGISTSGNSANVLNAINVAKGKNMKIIGLLGMTGGKILPLCDISIVVEHKETARIQESHLLIEHIWCDLIERILFPAQFI
jgi:D-sedoheptulose 7-phosphate isomerase